MTHTTHRRGRQKADEYARAGVPEYWLIDLIDRAIVVHREPVDGVYARVTRRSDGTLGVPRGGIDVGALLTAAG